MAFVSISIWGGLVKGSFDNFSIIGGLVFVIPCLDDYQMIILLNKLLFD